MIHSLYLSPRFTPAGTALPTAALHTTNPLLHHFEYSPHLRVLAQLHALGTRISRTDWDLLSLIPVAEYDPASCGHYPKRVIPSRLSRRAPSASSLLDDAPGAPAPSRQPHEPLK